MNLNQFNALKRSSLRLSLEKWSGVVTSTLNRNLNGKWSVDYIGIGEVLDEFTVFWDNNDDRRLIYSSTSPHWIAGGDICLDQNIGILLKDDGIKGFNRAMMVFELLEYDIEMLFFGKFTKGSVFGDGFISNTMLRFLEEDIFIKLEEELISQLNELEKSNKIIEYPIINAFPKS